MEPCSLLHASCPLLYCCFASCCWSTASALCFAPLRVSCAGLSAVGLVPHTDVVRGGAVTVFPVTHRVMFTLLYAFLYFVVSRCFRLRSGLTVALFYYFYYVVLLCSTVLVFFRQGSGRFRSDVVDVILCGIWMVYQHSPLVVANPVSSYLTSISPNHREVTSPPRPQLSASFGEDFELYASRRLALNRCMLPNLKWWLAFTFPGPVRFETETSFPKVMVFLVETFILFVFGFKAIVRRSLLLCRGLLACVDSYPMYSFSN